MTMDDHHFYTHRKNPLVGGACDGQVHEIPEEFRQGDRFVLPHPIDALTMAPLPADYHPAPALMKTELYRVLTLRVQDGPYDHPHTFYLGVEVSLTGPEALTMLVSGYRKERTNGRT